MPRRDRVDLVNTIGIPLLLALLGFIGAKVWQGVELAKENAIRREAIEKHLDEVRVDVKELRHDLDTLWADTSAKTAKLEEER